MEYVLVVLSRKRDGENQVVFVLKNRPAWQNNRLNLPGGKIEKGETPSDAARRELREETGIDSNRMILSGVLTDGESKIHVFTTDVYPAEKLQPRHGETEIPEWMAVSVAMKDPRLIPNLKVIVPMVLNGVKGWILEDNTKAKPGEHHTFSVTVLS